MGYNGNREHERNRSLFHDFHLRREDGAKAFSIAELQFKYPKKNGKPLSATRIRQIVNAYQAFIDAIPNLMEESAN